jgi:hypothetical protein
MGPQLEAVMVRGLSAPLSEREIHQLTRLLPERETCQIDVAACRRIVALGLADETPDGFSITALGRQRLSAEQNWTTPGGRSRIS